MQLVLGVTVIFTVSVNEPLDWYCAISTGVTVMFTVSVNEPLDWCSAISTGCDGCVYSQCE